MNVFVSIWTAFSVLTNNVFEQLCHVPNLIYMNAQRLILTKLK